MCSKAELSTLFERNPKELEFAFDKILAEIYEWYKVIVSNTQNAVMFVHRQTFLIIRPMSKFLDLKFYSKDQQPCPPFFKSTQVSKKFENHYRISSLDELSPTLIRLIRQSYELL
ncbi:DUF5655 domain-containing protein [Algoriphagus antarcticus]|nr:DUF5655 domain-containing protein [Algoriphagus antarcticus]